MVRRMLLLSVAVLFIGMFAMPSTVSLFTGQHTWKNLTEVASDTGCRKCHEDVYEETHSVINYVHWNIPGTKGTNDVFQCIECHTVDYNISSYYQTNISGNISGHAATTIACLSCHSGLAGLPANTPPLIGYIPGFCYSCHNGPYGIGPTQPGPYQFPMHALAYKYGVGHPENDAKRNCGQCHRDALNPTKNNVFIKLVNATITGADESHTLYYYQSKYPDNQTTIKLKDANTACLGCHSHAGVNITWRRSIGYELTVNATNAGMIVNFTGVSSSTNTTNSSGS